MTRKDYELIAKSLNSSFEAGSYWRHSIPSELYSDIVNDLADKIELENPRFDRAKFFSACYDKE